MSVIYLDQMGTILDHRRWIETTYQLQQEEHGQHSCSTAIALSQPVDHETQAYTDKESKGYNKIDDVLECSNVILADAVGALQSESSTASVRTANNRSETNDSSVSSPLSDACPSMLQLFDLRTPFLMVRLNMESSV